MTGDLGLLGNIVFDRHYNVSMKEEIEGSYMIHKATTLEDISIDYPLLVFGDSFSLQGKYQKYLSKELPFPIQTFLFKFTPSLSPENVAAFLLQSEKKLPPFIVIESVERSFIKRLEALSFCFDSDTMQIEPYLGETSRNILKKMREYYKRKLGLENVPLSVLHQKLEKSMFTCKGSENELYFYHEDTCQVSNESIAKAYKNLDLLYKLAKSKNVELIYVVAADKYDVYQDYIIDNPLCIIQKLRILNY